MVPIQPTERPLRGERFELRLGPEALTGLVDGWGSAVAISPHDDDLVGGS